MAIPTHIARRVLLDWHAGRTDGWGTVGGAVDAGESPAEAAVRESREEIGADVRLNALLGVLGGPDYEVTYPNGDRVAYVTAVFGASVVAGPSDGHPGSFARAARIGGCGGSSLRCEQRRRHPGR